jgi:Cation transport ATPase
LVPQGLVLSITIFFAYGAIKLLKDNVLMQEINATEKLARIKNLCVDKTGTLTERKPVLEEIINYNGNDFDLGQVLAGYIYANRDTSEIAAALRPRAALAFAGRVVDSLPFSSQRKYGAAWLEIGQKPVTAILGAPDVLAEYFADENEKKLVKEQVDVYAGKAKRLILLARAEKLPAGSLLIGNMLHPAALFVLLDPLRPGTEKIIDFFQKRECADTGDLGRQSAHGAGRGGAGGNEIRGYGGYRPGNGSLGRCRVRRARAGISSVCPRQTGTERKDNKIAEEIGIYRDGGRWRQ